ncbi:hypothetical protein ACSMXN_20815 [Jatrophihabitans sp. DSM 45814]
MAQLDALADFLEARAFDRDVRAVDREKTLGIVVAYRAGVTPPETESAMRSVANAFNDHPDFRAEWAPGL